MEHLKFKFVSTVTGQNITQVSISFIVCHCKSHTKRAATAAATTTITTAATTTTLLTYIHSIVPDSVKDQLDVESINTSGYMCNLYIHVCIGFV